MKATNSLAIREPRPIIIMAEGQHDDTYHIQGQTSYILNLPYEIIDMIFECLIGLNGVIDLTGIELILRRSRPHHPAWFWNKPDWYQKMHPILRTCCLLHDRGMRYIFQHHKFTGMTSVHLRKFPFIFNVQQMSMIQRLELKIDFYVKYDDEYYWPRCLDFLTEKFISLSFLKLYATYPTYLTADLVKRHLWNFKDFKDLPTVQRTSQGDVRYVDQGEDWQVVMPALREVKDPPGTSRDDQERRTILRLGAFVLLRHKNLSVMMYPAYSGESDGLRTTCAVELFSSQTRRSYKNVVGRLPPDSQEMRTIQDVVLNTTKIRRYTSRQLLTMPITSFVIPYSSETSEITENTTAFQHVDDSGYGVPWIPRRKAMFYHSEGCRDFRWNTTRAGNVDFYECPYQCYYCTSIRMTVDEMIIQAQAIAKTEVHLLKLKTDVQGHVEACDRFKLEVLDWLETLGIKYLNNR